MYIVAPQAAKKLGHTNKYMPVMKHMTSKIYVTFEYDLVKRRGCHHLTMILVQAVWRYKII